ncbi:MAG: 3-hydroxyacyl-CoA dehydrogenase/enoyl-CoA hydratase family protein [Desulfobacteraceae bacterium]|nr:MAG: 3-hydroxyacyl-CoA dehydrogenase/enoyl-CoA hydratase family protein [Desulfobacteraceae bacterium]
MESRNTLYRKSYNPLISTPSKPMPKEIAVIGAGTIGPDIGYYLKTALPDITLHLVDVVEAQLKNAEKRFAGYVQKAVEKKKFKEDKARAILSNINYTLDYGSVKNCQLVIEAATENLSLKQRIFETVESLVSRDTIITSNTSSIPASRIFSKMKAPQRATVTHFFAPAWRSLPVEVIVWEKVDQEVLDYLFQMFAATGKVPLATDDAICFMLDRIFDNWCNEAAYLLEHATASQIDKVAEEFVFAGPFYVLNMANGNPIIIETNTLQMEEGSHYRPAGILASVDRWHTQRPGSKVEVPEKVRSLVRDRLLGILFSQSFDIIDRNIGTMEDLNFGCQIALGFRKGPFDIMREIGASEVQRIMGRFISERPGFPTSKNDFSFYQRFNRFILVDDHKGTKIITIRRPQAMNALSDEVNDEILSVLMRYSDDPSVEGFVLTGYGTSAFSAGADIGKFPQMLGDKDASIRYAMDCARVQVFMDKMQKPVVAAVNGIALGGGLELAIRCHRIVAVKRASFQFPEVTLGILPAIGGCVVPYRNWPKGAKMFHEMLCLGRPMTALEALETGMVSKLVDSYPDLIEAAVGEVMAMKNSINRIPEGKIELPQVVIPQEPKAGSLNLSKETISIIAKTIEEGAAANSLDEALAAGYRGFGETACTDAAKEGIGSFLQKRKPVFSK